MKCEAEYCLYNRGFECIMKTTQINAFGMCEGCMTVSLDKDFLEREKERQLKEIEGRRAKATRE